MVNEREVSGLAASSLPFPVALTSKRKLPVARAALEYGKPPAVESALLYTSISQVLAAVLNI